MATILLVCLDFRVTVGAVSEYLKKRRKAQMAEKGSRTNGVQKNSARG
jgi:hypothetical protein